MVQLFAWLILMIICSGFWGVVIYFATDIIFEVPLTAFKCFGLGTVFYFFLVGLRESLKMAFEKDMGGKI